MELETEENRLNTACCLMGEFTRATGLTSELQPRRYLWTDAHAVCNLLALHSRLGDVEYLQQALALVDQVHHVLGRHRADDQRTGWISGLDENEATQHPTVGGLRIGKARSERAGDEPYDERLEWDRDGQYYHYLTKWMHALHQVACVTEDGRYHRWARELAVAACQGFTLPGAPVRLAWKMSIDLQRPLVPSSGHHDPLDGLVTVLVLAQNDRDEALLECRQSLVMMCRGRDWTTDDPLGIGGLLFDACRLAQLPATTGAEEILAGVVEAAVSGLTEFVRSPALHLPVGNRLGFREIGLSIGLGGIEFLNSMKPCEALRSFEPLAGVIEQFWLEPEHRRHVNWTEHQDISDVMLATSLLSPAFMSIHLP